MDVSLWFLFFGICLCASVVTFRDSSPSFLEVVPEDFFCTLGTDLFHPLPLGVLSGTGSLVLAPRGLC